MKKNNFLCLVAGVTSLAFSGCLEKHVSKDTSLYYMNLLKKCPATPLRDSSIAIIKQHFLVRKSKENFKTEFDLARPNTHIIGTLTDSVSNQNGIDENIVTMDLNGIGKVVYNRVGGETPELQFRNNN